jgi:uncharacterized protein YjbI with pentapeptide repeats
MGKETRRIGPYDRSGHVVSEHARSVTTKPKKINGALANPTLQRAVTQMAAEPQGTLPDLTWYETTEVPHWEVLERRHPYVVDGKTGRISLRNFIDPETGCGEVILSKASGDDEQTQKVGPGEQISDEFLDHVDYRRSNLENAELGYHTSFCDFGGANLNGARFGAYTSKHKIGVRGSVRDTSFDGASCAQTSFVNMRFLGKVSFRGADLTDANFLRVSLGAMLPEGGQVPITTIDFTDSNVTGQQIDQVLERNLDTEPDSAPSIIYRTYNVQEACDTLGVNETELMVLIWVQDIEVRDNVTKALVRTGFNKDRHHIPQWALPSQRNR